jgi:S1-C subfamily serine protease
VGDIIRAVNGQPVALAVEAQRLIYGATIGDTLTLTMEREGNRWEVTLTLQEAPGR